MARLDTHTQDKKSRETERAAQGRSNALPQRPNPEANKKTRSTNSPKRTAKDRPKPTQIIETAPKRSVVFNITENPPCSVGIPIDSIEVRDQINNNPTNHESNESLARIAPKKGNQIAQTDKRNGAETHQEDILRPEPTIHQQPEIPIIPNKPDNKLSSNDKVPEVYKRRENQPIQYIEYSISTSDETASSSESDEESDEVKTIDDFVPINHTNSQLLSGPKDKEEVEAEQPDKQLDIAVSDKPHQVRKTWTKNPTLLNTMFGGFETKRVRIIEAEIPKPKIAQPSRTPEVNQSIEPTVAKEVRVSEGDEPGPNEGEGDDAKLGETILTTKGATVVIETSTAQTMKFLLDTGSEVNLISRNHLRSFNEGITEYQGPALYSGTNHQFQIIGSLKTELKHKNTKWKIEFIVVNEDLEHPILGDHWLKNNNAIINFRTRKLHLESSNDEPSEIPATIPVRSTRVTRIKAHEARFVEVNLPTNQIGTSYIIEPSILTSGALRTARQITKDARVMIANWGQETISIAAGALIGQAEIVEDVHPTKYQARTKQTVNTVHAENSYEEYVTPEQDTSKANIGEDLKKSQKDEVKAFLKKWTRIFAANPQGPGKYKGPKIAIPTTGKPIKRMPRRVNPIKEEEIKRQINLMLKNGIIEPSKGPWAAPVVLAPKKDGTSRFCIDYRELNNITTKDAYPVPRIDDTLDALGNQNAKIFTTLDCASGYWQLPLEDEDKEKTAFTTQSGTYQFTVLPFGLTGAPGAFCRAMQSTLTNFMWKSCLCFVDDLIIWSSSYEDHFQDLNNIFDALDTNGLSLKLSKCRFFMQEVEYLGYIIRPGQIQTCANKVMAINEFPPPKSLKSLQRFLGMVGWYRRFVRNFAQIAKPLYALLSKEAKKEDWRVDIPESDQNIAFNLLKQSLKEGPILKLPDWGKPFLIAIDGSETGTGAVLMQDYDGIEMPVAYTSKTIKPFKRKKFTGSYRHEVLGLVRALRTFKHYITGTRATIITDCGALSKWKTTKEIIEFAAKYMDEIESYDFDIVHRAGKQNVVSDALSRVSQDEKEEEERTMILFVKQRKMQQDKTASVSQAELNAHILGITPNHIEDMQRKSQEARDVYNHLVHGALPTDDRKQKETLRLASTMVVNNGIIFHVPPPGTTRSARMWIPDEGFQKQILYRLHDDPLAGHLGIQKTEQRIAERFWWPAMKKTITEYVNNCYSCKVNKPQHAKTTAQLEPLEIGAPWKDVQSDFIGPLNPETKDGNKYICTFICRFTKWIELVAMKNKEAGTTARTFMERVVLRWGTPDTFLCDNDGSYQAEFRGALNKLNVKAMKILPYAHNSNGLAERYNKTIEEVLRHYINSNLNNWDELLPYVQFALNTSVARSHGHTPFYLNTGRLVISPFSREIGFEDDTQLIDDYEYDFSKRLHEGWRAAKQSTKKYQDNMIQNNPPQGKPIKDGDLVKVRYPNRNEGKLKSIFHGPYRVKGTHGGHNYILLREADGEPFTKHLHELELWQGNEDETIIPQESYDEEQPKSKKQKDMIIYAKTHTQTEGKNWLPTDLIGRRVQIFWTQRHSRGNFAGTIIDFAKAKKKYLVKYDIKDDKTGHDTYEEDLLGINPPTWKFIDIPPKTKASNKKPERTVKDDEPVESNNQENKSESDLEDEHDQKEPTDTKETVVEEPEITIPKAGPAKRGRGRPRKARR